MRTRRGQRRRARVTCRRTRLASTPAFAVALTFLLYAMHLTGWTLELLWLGPGRLRPWPWIAPTGMVVQAFRRVLLLFAAMDTAAGLAVYLAVALGGGGAAWGQRGRGAAWIAAGLLLAAVAAALEWYGVRVSGSWSYRRGTPQLPSPWGAWALFPLLRRIAVPLLCYRLAWRLAR